METITIAKSEYQELIDKNKLVNQLEKQAKEFAAKNEELLNQNNELLSKIKILEEKILDLHRRLFDKKKDQTNNKQIKIGKKSNNNKEGKRGRKPTDKSNIDVTKNYDFATTPSCPDCNKIMDGMGCNNSYHEDYRVIIQKVKISQAKYICRDCDVIVVANGNRLPIRKGLPMPRFLAQVVLDKFSNGLPCYRQAQSYGYAHHRYTRQMFNNWIMQAAELASPLLNLMLFKMLQSNYLASDETGIVLLNLEGKNPGSKGYMCVLKQHGENFNFVYCWVIRSRKQGVINDKLKHFKGYLQSDGLNFYFKLKNMEGITLTNCWAHARRKFIEIVKLSNTPTEGIASNIVEKIDLLYDIDRKTKGLNLAEILKSRKECSVPILTELKTYLESNLKTTPPKSKLGIAINYVLNRWEELTVYTKDAKLDIDNNHTERCIKYIVIGRKGWLFADNIDSANKLGILYSLIISCKINNINPRTYLEYIFTQMPYINKNNLQEVEQLLPDRFNTDKRFDQEYLERRGIIEKTIYHQDNNINLHSSKVA